MQLSTPVQYLEETDAHQETTPGISTWGEEGYFAVWLDESNAWVYRPLRNAEQKMVDLADRFIEPTGQERRLLCQAGRELILAQASDWPFIIKTGTTVEYAESRLREHLKGFLRLVEMLESGDVEESFVGELEAKNNLFPEIDPEYWRSTRVR